MIGACGVGVCAVVCCVVYQAIDECIWIYSIKFDCKFELEIICINLYVRIYILYIKRWGKEKQKTTQIEWFWCAQTAVNDSLMYCWCFFNEIARDLSYCLFIASSGISIKRRQCAKKELHRIIHMYVYELSFLWIVWRVNALVFMCIRVCKHNCTSKADRWARKQSQAHIHAIACRLCMENVFFFIEFLYVLSLPFVP